MGSFDYEVAIMELGFGGSVAALRAAERATGSPVARGTTA
jgi:hypothetical protein